MTVPWRARLSRRLSRATFEEPPPLHLRKEVAHVHVVLLLGRKRAVVLASLVRLGLGRLGGILLRQGGNLLVVALRHRCCSGLEVPLSTQRSGGASQPMHKVGCSGALRQVRARPPPAVPARIKASLTPPCAPRLEKGRARRDRARLELLIRHLPRGACPQRVEIIQPH